MEAQLLDEPVVEHAMRFEFQRADRMGDSFQRIALPVGPVVHRVDAPLITGSMMMRMPDPIEQRVAHQHIRMRHVDLRAKNVGAVFELARPHPPKEVEILFYGS